MNSHPGGADHTRRMLSLALLPRGSSVLDMGAGAGEAVTLLCQEGYAARGIDLLPRGDMVEQGNFLHAPFPDRSFDAVLSQCAFFVSGNQTGALREAHRLLRSNGLLMVSDVFFEAPKPLLEKTGFAVIQADDMTAMWREYYLEALWREDSLCCEIPRGTCQYWLMIGRKV